MKKLLLSLAFLIVGYTTSTAQKAIESGYVKMEITEATSDNDQMAMALEMMKGTATEIYFNNEFNLSKMNMMGGMVEITNLVNNSTAKTDMLFNAMGQKMHVEAESNDVTAVNAEQEAMMKSMKVSYDKEDTKTILGYECYKATFTSSEVEGFSFTMYITDKIKANSEVISAAKGLEFEGFPLEFEVNNPQMTMVIKAIELKDEIDPSVFKLNTAGYQKLTMKEFQEKMGAMGGGFGF